MVCACVCVCVWQDLIDEKFIQFCQCVLRTRRDPEWEFAKTLLKYLEKEKERLLRGKSNLRLQRHCFFYF